MFKIKVIWILFGLFLIVKCSTNDPQATFNWTFALIPDDDMPQTLELYQKLDEFLKSFLKSVQDNIKEDGLSRGFQEAGFVEPLESFFLSYRIFLYDETKSMLSEIKYLLLDLHRQALQNPQEKEPGEHKEVVLPQRRRDIFSRNPGWVFDVRKLISSEDPTQQNISSNATPLDNNKPRRKLYFSTDYTYRPADCSDILISGKKESGIYEIYPFRCACTKPVEVYCDMETDGGGWTVFLKRGKQTNQLNFTRMWRDYKEGFGTPEEEYWIGNDALHYMTSNRNYMMRLDAMDVEGREIWGQWTTFQVASEFEKYKLTVNGYDPNSIMADKLTHMNLMLFSTYERDNDLLASNCAAVHVGGWWFGIAVTPNPLRCNFFNPTGIYGVKSIQGIEFYGWSKTDLSGRVADWLQMKIRPKLCSEKMSMANLNTHNCLFH